LPISKIGHPLCDKRIERRRDPQIRRTAEHNWTNWKDPTDESRTSERGGQSR